MKYTKRPFSIDEQVGALLLEHPRVPRGSMGFPKNWLDSPLWKGAVGVMKRLVATLREQQAEAAKLDAEIEKNLLARRSLGGGGRGLGYGG